MLSTILKDIKNMLLKPVLFLILIFGFIAASASSILYYSYGSISLNVKSTMLNQDRVIEVKGYFGANEFYGIDGMIEEGRIPSVGYITAISYNSFNYDLIGLRSIQNTSPQQRATISESAMRAKTYALSLQTGLATKL